MRLERILSGLGMLAEKVLEEPKPLSLRELEIMRFKTSSIPSRLEPLMEDFAEAERVNAGTVLGCFVDGTSTAGLLLPDPGIIENGSDPTLRFDVKDYYACVVLSEIAAGLFVDYQKRIREAQVLPGIIYQNTFVVNFEVTSSQIHSELAFSNCQVLIEKKGRNLQPERWVFEVDSIKPLPGLNTPNMPILEAECARTNPFLRKTLSALGKLSSN